MMMMLWPKMMMTTMMCPKCWYLAFIHKYHLPRASLFTQSNISIVLRQFQPARKKTPVLKQHLCLCLVCGLLLSAFITKILHA